MRIKICGITRVEDAQQAMQLGAWALGFIFYKKSPRWVDPATVRQILSELESQGLCPEHRVGVFVNAGSAEIQQTVLNSGINTVQLHGDETPADCAALDSVAVWKAFRLSGAEQLTVLGDYANVVQAFLFDAAVLGQYGGTGQLTDWSLVAGIKSPHPVILSGGLHPENIRIAAAQVQAYAYDLSSGVEQRPGIKDSDKLTKLFKQGSAL